MPHVGHALMAHCPCLQRISEYISTTWMHKNVRTPRGHLIRCKRQHFQRITWMFGWSLTPSASAASVTTASTKLITCQVRLQAPRHLAWGSRRHIASRLAFGPNMSLNAVELQYDLCGPPASSFL